ncbi:DUF1700 domain-containing protein [Konateibacter massiliensis]|uniref:DUF1700 domain-containing protein n=1 Tax=Konateibacter massiliensis TaxID=2002841 RepID=UPI000C153F6E|nr:DUF1700 domain-containing protein [Konateibacter massiliensis]
MSRKEFMEKLENLLGNIQDSEREEALQYYNDYFDEAGPENENQVIIELGTPEKVAAIIKTSLQENINESGEFTERGYSDPRFVINYEVADNHDTKEQSNSRRTYRKDTKEASGGKIALIIILLILAIPVGLPLLGGLFGLIVGLVGGAIGIFAGIVGLAIAGVLGGVTVFVVGFVTLFTSPLAGIFSCGVGLLLLGVGSLLTLLSVQICWKFIPWLFRNIVELCRMPFKRRGVMQ